MLNKKRYYKQFAHALIGKLWVFRRQAMYCDNRGLQLLTLSDKGPVVKKLFFKNFGGGWLNNFRKLPDRKFV